MLQHFVSHKRGPGPLCGKSIDELYKQVGDCWIWQGSVHRKGVPIFRGRDYPKVTLYYREKGPLKAGQRFRGQTCGNKLCVNPEHQIVQNPKRRRRQEGLWI